MCLLAIVLSKVDNHLNSLRCSGRLLIATARSDEIETWRNSKRARKRTRENGCIGGFGGLGLVFVIASRFVGLAGSGTDSGLSSGLARQRERITGRTGTGLSVSLIFVVVVVNDDGFSGARAV